MQSGILDEIELSLDHPAACAQKLLHAEADIGLVPVATLPHFKDYHIISNYCLGADGEVKTVLLCSQVPLDKIDTIYLDYQSRTSAMLVQILAHKFWRTEIAFKKGFPHFEEAVIKSRTAALVIGDRSLDIAAKSNYIYDLSAEWKKFTGLPFVFATWTSNSEMPNDFLQRFNQALEWGLQNKDQSISMLSGEKTPTSFNLQEYLNKNISYTLTDTKRAGLNLFLEYLCNLQSCEVAEDKQIIVHAASKCICKNKLNSKVSIYEK